MEKIVKRQGHCKTGKNRYASSFDAKLALAQCKGSASLRRRECRTYHCPICKGWHLTSHEDRRYPIAKQDYVRCLSMLEQDGGNRMRRAIQSFRVANNDDPHIWRGFIVAAALSWLEAGLPEELLDNVQSWYALRLGLDSGKQSLDDALTGFRKVCSDLSEEYSKEHQTVIHPEESNPLARCWVEGNCMKKFGVPAWIYRTAEARSLA
ncbi:hypothetical protein [Bifidobacterium callitrichidarum]|uniref:Uncharacterized protein n=1 Tax=Bifidobacterium callitrichidarum TaxID=2052941 RepID=A0A2U2N921_9BIFI|nr:hypothetical protein [Bifidobacterium callitrichidarum]PWG65590.1 hypothetical protein DF196_06550 [Bifidobacterium callitrichidarum]